MAEKIINTRIQNRIDTLANWTTNNPTLKKGEVAFATVAAGEATGLSEPVIMAKIGDGTSNFTTLKWSFAAKASDVLAVCKNEDSLKEFIDAQIAAANLAGSGDLNALAARVEAVEKNKVNSVAAADDSVTVGGTSVAPTVGVQISTENDNALQLKSTGNKGLYVKEVDVPEYTLTSESSTDYAAVYKFKKDGTEIGTINIPKDMVVSSGEVRSLAAGEAGTGKPAGTYIVLTLANATNDTLYINVTDLIEYVSGATAADGIITTNVDTNNVLTATITDGTINIEKLEQDVQDKINAGGTAIQSVSAAANSGLKATTTNKAVSIEIDTATTFVFDCGDSQGNPLNS